MMTLNFTNHEEVGRQRKCGGRWIVRKVTKNVLACFCPRVHCEAAGWVAENEIFSFPLI